MRRHLRRRRSARPPSASPPKASRSRPPQRSSHAAQLLTNALGNRGVRRSGENHAMPDGETLSDRLERWLSAQGTKTIGNLIDVFEEKSFAVLFVLLLAVPALPLPTGGVTHVFEVIAALLALELIVGRRKVWLPDRWRQREISPEMRRCFSEKLLPRIRWIEGHSHARLGFLLSHRVSGVVFGAVTLGLIVTAFLAPPFTGLDTLPALGVVLISLGVLLEDPLLGIAGLVVGATGVFLVIFLGKAAIDAIRGLF